MAEQAATGGGMKIPGWVWLAAGGVGLMACCGVIAVVAFIFLSPALFPPKLPADAQKHVDSELKSCPGDDCSVVLVKQLDVSDYNDYFEFDTDADEAWCLTIKLTNPDSTISQEDEIFINTFLARVGREWGFANGNDEDAFSEFGCRWFEPTP